MSGGGSSSSNTNNSSVGAPHDMGSSPILDTPYGDLNKLSEHLFGMGLKITPEGIVPIHSQATNTPATTPASPVAAPPTVNLNNIAPGVSSTNPLQTTQSPTPTPPIAQPPIQLGSSIAPPSAPMSFNQAYAPINDSMERNTDFSNWLQSMQGK